MAIEQINIDIIDTQTNTSILQYEFAEINAPKLVYNGADDRFQTLMTSELQFNMFVPDAQDGKFLHLFTGDETRFKIQVNDITIPASPVLLWQGHLLPEQFSEPYQNGAFFVEFIATDGIGRLKNQYLPDAYYQDEKNIALILAECLKLTGNEFELFIASGIKNSIADLKWSDLAINTLAYKNKDKKKDAYFILEALIKSFGCKLFQSYGAWYIVGINRFKDISIVFNKFNKDGLFISSSILNRNVNTAIFEAKPTISTLPKIHEVFVDWKSDKKEQLLPVDVVDQEDYFFEQESNIVDVRYFDLIGETTDFKIGLSPYRSNITYIYDRLDGEQVDINAYLQFVALTDTRPEWFYFTIYAGHSDVVNHYVQLENRYYLKGDPLGSAKIDFELDMKMTITGTATGAQDVTDIEFNEGFIFELRLNDTVILTNVVSTDTELVVSSEYFTTKTGKITFKGLLIKEDGYLTLVFRNKNIVHGHNVLKVVYKTLSIIYKNKKETSELIKNRDISFTTKKEVSIEHSGNLVDNSLKNILISKDYNFAGATESIPEYTQQINGFNYTSWQSARGGQGWLYYVGVASYEITYQEYLDIKTYAGFMVKKVGGNLPYISLSGYPDAVINGATSNYYFRSESPPPNSTNYKFLSTDEIWIHRPASSNFITDKWYLKDKWARFEQTETLVYLEVLARIYHDSLKENRLVINGNLFGLKLPFDIMNFDYLSLKQFVSTKLTLNLVDGMTEVIMIEDKQENVTDYAG